MAELDAVAAMATRRRGIRMIDMATMEIDDSNDRLLRVTTTSSLLIRLPSSGSAQANTIRMIVNARLVSPVPMPSTYRVM